MFLAINIMPFKEGEVVKGSPPSSALLTTAMSNSSVILPELEDKETNSDMLSRGWLLTDW